MARALDQLVEMLDRAVAEGESPDVIAPAVGECARIARATAIPPETMIAALKPRLEAAVARAAPERTDEYLRALVSLAINSYFASDSDMPS